MYWYDIPIFMILIIGVLLIALSHYHGRKMGIGLFLILTAIILKTALWFEGLI